MMVFLIILCGLAVAAKVAHDRAVWQQTVKELKAIGLRPVVMGKGTIIASYYVEPIPKQSPNER